MKRIAMVLIVMCFFMTGCFTTGSSTFPVQIVSHDEALAGAGFAAKIAANYIKLKYPAEVQTILTIANQAVNADTDKILEEKAQELIDKLVNEIKDPEARIAVMALRDSFEIDIDTSKIVFDPGARQTVLGVIKIIISVLEG